MTYYTQQSEEDVGIGQVVSFATEQHPKKRENKIGILTLQVYEHAADNKPATKMMIKCTKIDPVLKGVIMKECSFVMQYKEPLKKHINEYLRCQYMYSSQKAEGGMSELSDSLYVLGIQMTQHESAVLGSSNTLFSAWGGSNASATVIPIGTTATKKAKVVHGAKTANTVKTPHDTAVPGSSHTLFSAWGISNGAAAVVPNGPAVTNKANVVHGTKTAKAAKTSPVVTMHDGSNHKRTNMEIKFCRVEDVPLIMQACRVFFKQMQTSSVRIGVEFPRGELPMWWKYLHNLYFRLIPKKHETYS